MLYPRRLLTAVRGLLLFGAVTALPACTSDDVTQAEAKEALDEANWSTQSSALTAEVAEISTHFTLGQAADQAAKNLRDFVQTEVPCAKLTVADASLTIDFGALSDNCKWHGHVITGQAKIAVQRADVGQVQVTHTWTGLSNGLVKLDGTATVTWSAAEGTRRVVHQVTAASLDQPTRTLTGSGDRTQRLVDPAKGWLGGIEIDGSRQWTSAKGTWSLAIAGVQVRALDPVPQAGTYTLTTPAGKTLGLSFSRLDTVTIQVTVTGMRQTYTFKVLSLAN